MTMSPGRLPAILLFSASCILYPPAARSGGEFSPHHLAAQQAREQRIIGNVVPQNCEQVLFELVKNPHHAGGPGDYATALYLDSLYRSFGFVTTLATYDVYLPYPREISVTLTAPERISLSISEDSLQEGALLPFNAYSPSGDVDAELVYVNRGLETDYATLAEMGIDVRGRILLARYGGGYRGGKAFLAEQHGAAGLILYSDPADDGYMAGDVYPRGPMRPWDAVQRGSIGYATEYIGDPLTPGVAATKDAPRLDPERSARMPRIPTTPIAYRDALVLLRHLGGPAVPRAWQGGLPLTYHIGPGTARVHMHLLFDYRLRTIWNNIATITGSAFPDERIIVGNHRDAWVNGAVDPNSSTAALVETARCLAIEMRDGWRPRRTLQFCHWDGEEFGIIGSTEWGEEFSDDLSREAMVYLNFDASVTGSTFGASGVPSLDKFIRSVASTVPGIKPDTASVFPGTIGRMGGGSDFAVFLNHLGIPGAEWSFGGPYGVYHSAYDNFSWMKHFGDPAFTSHAQLARTVGIAVTRFADADLLPFRYDDYAREIGEYAHALDKRLKEQGDSSGVIAPLFAPLRTLGETASRLHDETTRLLSSGPIPEDVNRQLALVERDLTAREGLPGRKWFRHLIYAPGAITGYATQTLPGVSDQIDSTTAGRQGLHAAVEVLTGAVRAATERLSRATEILRHE